MPLPYGIEPRAFRAHKVAFVDPARRLAFCRGKRLDAAPVESGAYAGGLRVISAGASTTVALFKTLLDNATKQRQQSGAHNFIKKKRWPSPAMRGQHSWAHDAQIAALEASGAGS
jgi:hypothetical protein